MWIVPEKKVLVFFTFSFFENFGMNKKKKKRMIRRTFFPSKVHFYGNFSKMTTKCHEIVFVL